MKLAADEIAVFIGHTAERATAGLLKAGVFRTVSMRTLPDPPSLCLLSQAAEGPCNRPPGLHDVY